MSRIQKVLYQPPAWWLPVIIVGGVIALVLLGILLLRVVRRIKKTRRLLLQHEAQVQTRIMEATKKLSTLSFSMCFVPFSKLRQHGKPVPHEEARLANELVVIDSLLIRATKSQSLGRARSGR